MQSLKLIFVALILTIPLLGCGGTNPPIVVTEGGGLSPEQIAEQDSVLNAAEAAERAQKKAR